MKLIFDEMLKSLASWCRILGIYSEFYSGKSDSYLLDRAQKHGLVLVTRDFQLSLRCEKRGVKCIFVRSDRIEEQIAQVIGQSGAEVTFPEKTRCASCNGELNAVPKESVAEGLPANVVGHHDRFWRCQSCGKVFWEGGHWKNIIRIYGRAKEIIAGARPS